MNSELPISRILMGVLVFKKTKQFGLLGLASLFFVYSQNLSANVKLNAMCFAENNQKPKPFIPTKSEKKSLLSKKVYDVSTDEFSLKEKFRIASLSKIVTTHWAITKLGPSYRFTTNFFVKLNEQENSCNVHIDSEMDPYLGKEILDHAWGQLTTELNKHSCKRISQLSIGSNVFYRSDLFSYRKNNRMAWEDPSPYKNQNISFDELKNYFSRNSHMKVQAQNIQKDSNNLFFANNESDKILKYSFKSMPLYKMAKDFNNISYNYPPEILFEKLGGAAEYANFIRNRLGFEKDQIEMYNGSGYPVELAGLKKYNLVSCYALVRIMQDLEYVIRVTSSERLQIYNVIGVGGGEDNTTFSGLYSSDKYKNAIVAKTGTADNTITFGGMFTYPGGKIYFSVLTNPNNASVSTARLNIRHLMDTLVERYATESFAYSSYGEMPAFDEFSHLMQS